jgi:hypothetical protein
MVKIIAALLVPALAIAGEAGPTGGNAPSSVFAEGDRLEEAGEYEKAIALYERLQGGREEEALWAYSDMGEAAPEERREALFEKLGK